MMYESHTSRQKWINLALGINVCLLLLVGGMYLCYDRYITVSDYLSSAQGHLRALEEMISAPSKGIQPQSMERARAELSQAKADFQAVRDELGPLLPLGRCLSWLPFVGEDVEATPHLLEMAIDLATAGEATLVGWGPAVDSLTTENRTAESFSAYLLPALIANQPTFDRARVALEDALEERQMVDPGQLSPRLAGLLARMDGYLPFLRAAVWGPALASELLGVASPRAYLILIQNGDELRATGGFISGVGLLRLEGGRITALNFLDSSAIDDLNVPHPPPPEPLARYMRAGRWVLRDVNWSPDFPTVARAAQDLYKLDQGMEVDGVVAVNLMALRYTLEAIGPIEVEAYGLRADAANVQELLKRYWTAPLEAASVTEGEESDWWRHRKDFMGELLKATAAELERGLTAEEIASLLEAWRRGLAEKHILIYLNDIEAERLLVESGWDGALRSAEGDYLMVVDNNVGFNKVNANIEEEIEYRVVLGEGGARGQVTLIYHNRSTPQREECRQEPRYETTYEGLTERCYWDYVRLYVPRESHLVGFDYDEDRGELADVTSEGDKEVFAAFFVLPPGAEGRLTFNYELPPRVWAGKAASEGEYRLLVQKQPGTTAVPLRVRVESPPGWMVGKVSPQSAFSPISERGEEAVKCQTTLATDQHLTMRITSMRGGRQWGEPQLWLALGGLALLGGVQAFLLLRGGGPERQRI